VSTNGAPIRILLVGEAREARRLRGLLDSKGSTQFQISHVPAMESAAECVARDNADVLLVDMGLKQPRGLALIQAARAAAPDKPVVILSESENEAFAVESLQQGIQDFLTKDHMDCVVLVRALRYSIERHRLQRKLQNLSLIDDLTGLNNRRGFLALAEQHLRFILRKGTAMLVYLDVDNLKLINDTFGHLQGNRALVVTANILRACFRQSDILARLGGDEFCVLMTDAGQDTSREIRKRLHKRLDLTNRLPAWGFRVSLSVGIAEVPAAHPPLEELLRIADEYMYVDKRNNRAALPATICQSSPV
jgi:two-component system cell cycle response regulator